MKIISALLDLIYPPKCPFCERVLEKHEDGLCDRCQRELPWITGEEPERTVEFCAASLSPLWYREKTVDGVHRYKYLKRSTYALLFGTLMAQCVHDRLSGTVDLVTWVPLSDKRKRERGFDQAQLLAERTAEVLQVPVARTLEKWHHTSAQALLDDPAARRANVRGVYRVPEDCAVAGKHILLVDDVTTTGATLSECAACLLAAGASYVTALTLARAGK